MKPMSTTLGYDIFIAEPIPQNVTELVLREVTLVDRDAVNFLADCEGAGATLENCPAYVREWIAGERAETRDSPRKPPTRRNPER